MQFIESAKYVSRKTLVFSFLLGFLLVTGARADSRVDTVMNSAWKFDKADVTNAQSSSFDDSSWSAIDLPHTWNALDGEDGGNDYYRGIGWYRKHCTIGSENSGKRVYLFFESVGIAADVYCNGTSVGSHLGAYAAFCFDITDAVHFGADNVIAVKVNNSKALGVAPLDGDFTQWGGICRSVRLLITNPVHITPLDYASPGVYLTPTHVSRTSSDLSVKTLIRNAGTTAKDVTVRATIKDANNNTVGTPLALTQSVAANTTTNFVQDTTVSSPHLWDGLADPYLYKVLVEVETDGAVVDSINQPLGFRYYRIDSNQGFFLNDHYLDLHGAAIHEDRDHKGRAISDADREQDVQIMLEMGSTWIRLAHYQHAEKIYELADEKGLVLSTEIPVVDNIATTTVFSDNCKSQLKELIRQNYNHPSVFFWGIFNEVTLHPGPNPTALMKELNALAKAEDPTRLTIAANNTSNTDPTTYTTDVVGFNKYFGWYNGAATDFAGWADGIHASRGADKIGITEYGAGASIHQHEENPPEPPNAGPWHPEEYQSYYHEVHWKAMAARPYLWCKALWNGFDFGSDGRMEGDRHGINDKGLVLRDRTIKKDAFYWYKANWSSEPMVYITGRRFTPRNLNPGLMNVKVYSNCKNVELFINSQSKGVLTSTDHIYRWESVELGLVGTNEIKAVGFGMPNVPPEKITSKPTQMCVDLVRIFRTNNKPPEAEILSPSDGEKVPGDKDVLIKVKASDPDGTIDRVEFYKAKELIGKVSTPPYTFAWDIPDGCYTISAKAVNNKGLAAKTKTVKITKGIGCPQRPFHGAPARLPGRIEAEDFDLGVRGEAYWSPDEVNQGGKYRLDVGAGIQDCDEGGYDIGWIVTGEWLKYSVDVAESGLYDITFRVASPEGAGKLHLELDGVDKTGVLNTPNTGGWQKFTDLTTSNIKLKAGKQMMRFVVDAGRFNFNYLEVVPSKGKENTSK